MIMYIAIGMKSNLISDLKLVTLNILISVILLSTAWLGHFDVLRGYDSLQTASEVTFDLRFEILDLSNLCYHGFVASICNLFR